MRAFTFQLSKAEGRPGVFHAAKKLLGEVTLLCIKCTYTYIYVSTAITSKGGEGGGTQKCNLFLGNMGTCCTGSLYGKTAPSVK